MVIWIVRKNHETRIQTAEMKVLRGVVGNTSTDRLNAEIRKELKVLA